MHNRLDLHEMLCDILGSRNVYYSPPASVKMSYPAIVYTRSDIGNTHADDSVYKQTHSYSVTIIDGNPDSDIVERMSRVPKCKFDRHYVSDNLNHDTFTIYI